MPLTPGILSYLLMLQGTGQGTPKPQGQLSGSLMPKTSTPKNTENLDVNNKKQLLGGMYGLMKNMQSGASPFNSLFKGIGNVKGGKTG